MAKGPEIPGIRPYTHPAGGWDALAAVEEALAHQKMLLEGSEDLLRMNQPDGFDCPGCAWPDPVHTSTFEFCENGAKAVSWEASPKRVTREFMAAHTVEELLRRSDYELEDQGRLSEPMAYDLGSDRYLPISWEEAFSRIGAALRTISNPDAVEFYTSGRASNEASFLFQLFGRAFGTNNFPECSNLCHEPTSVGLTESIGVGKGTVTLEDFDHCDAIISFGHNPGTNHPRMMTTLRNASRRGAAIVALNPFRERALERFTAPQSPLEMATLGSTPIASSFLQVKIGGDVAVIKGMMKRILERDALDHDFISRMTAHFDSLRADIESTKWTDIVVGSGIGRETIEKVADIYIGSQRVIATYGMGICQHSNGTANVQQIINLLLMRGNMGRPGAGICPLRGHSNVQGNRTVGINDRPSAALLDGIERTFGFRPPARPGHRAIDAVASILRGDCKALICLGGNFAVAMPDRGRVFPAIRQLDLVVSLATKLNRTHLLTAKQSFILPVIGRTEVDIQTSGPQKITVEDSMAMVHASKGWRPAATEMVRSEPWIIASMAKATLGSRHGIAWDEMVADYDVIRDRIAAVFPEFGDYNARIRTPGGFRLPVPASERIFNTPDGKAQFVLAPGLAEDPAATGADTLILGSVRSHDQYNTTVYGLDDRYRGVFGRRDILFMSTADMSARSLAPGDLVDVTAADDEPNADGFRRVVRDLTVVPYDLPQGSIGAYFPECQVLFSLPRHDPRSGIPSFKSVVVRVTAAREA
ncbi:FdhF/YdeP family oxidoreductase [Methylocystis echinoides]|uniref:Formate dehydrogenase subunit alpha n=1 Tax=Methylocystis echinoides TaxID=29468 RepID=A0A9W6GXC6_9HYPH|nr:FdhF/YdeP family oxidoreductase [Methylocystis echinoides]GLI94887.1 formate dehydrogenase subunit alpha [Methylocystis echinoides]